MPSESAFVPPDASGVCTLVLNRPAKANALSAELVEELMGYVSKAVVEDAQLLVLKANGKHFCAGFDFSGYETQSEGDLLRRFVRIEQLLQTVRNAPLATLACVQGAAYGAGADLAAACAYRIGGAAARFRFPGFQFGVALGTRHLAGIVGSARARQLLIGNETLNAEQALACGLLTHHVEPERFDDFARELAAAAQGCGGAALSRLLSNTGQDSNDRDLAELVRSLVVPGLHERMRRYRSTA